MQNTYDERMEHEAADGAQAEADAEMQQRKGFSTALWKGKNGQTFCVADMDIEHINNIRKMLDEKILYMQNWKITLNAELISRKNGRDVSKIYNQTAGWENMPPAHNDY